MSDDTWDPDRYERFRDQRDRPALDLLAMATPIPGGSAADLGCGTGRFTVLVHERLQATRTVGIDTSDRMLSEALNRRTDGVEFHLGDIADLDDTWDVLYSNAALHWVPDHHELLPRLADRLAPGGQLVFQVPANFDHVTHVVADEVGRRFGMRPLADTAGVLHPRTYAEILHGAGLTDLEVHMRIYGSVMERTEEVIDFVAGSLLTPYERTLEPEDFSEFRAQYRTELLDRLGDPAGNRPYYHAFARTFCRARRSD